MNKEPDNFPLFPHLRERSNKGIDRYTQRSKWVTELLDWPNLPNDLLAAAKEAEFCLRDQVIVLFVCDSGARPSEVIELSIGEWRTRGCQPASLYLQCISFALETTLSGRRIFIATSWATDLVCAAATTDNPRTPVESYRVRPPQKQTGTVHGMVEFSPLE